MTHNLTAAKVDKPATPPQRSAAASRNEMHTDIVGARTCEVTADAEYAVRSMLTIARMPATLTDDAKWCATMLDYMHQQYDAGQRAANAELVEAAKAVVQAWVHDEIGQIDGSHIEDLTAAINKHGGASNV